MYDPVHVLRYNVNVIAECMEAVTLALLENPIQVQLLHKRVLPLFRNNCTFLWTHLGFRGTSHFYISVIYGNVPLNE